MGRRNPVLSVLQVWILNVYDATRLQKQLCKSSTHFRGGMGWLRLVGSLKLYVSFAGYSLFYRALLQKRPMILRSLLIVATP